MKINNVLYSSIKKVFGKALLFAVASAIISLAGNCSGNKGMEISNQALLSAITQPDPSLEEIEKLIDGGADINFIDHHGDTMLNRAITSGNYDVARLLLSKGADKNAKGMDGWTPLHVAIYKGNYGMIDTLVTEYKADLSLQDELGQTPLHQAATYNQPNTIRLLVKNGANINIGSGSKIGTPLHAAAMGNPKIKTELCLGAEELIKSGANIDAQAGDGFTPLHIAVKNSMIEMVELLLKNKANSSIKTNTGHTPLCYAINKKNANMVKVLLNNGVNPDEPIITGHTPLHMAANDNNAEIIKILLDNGADFRKTNAKEGTGHNALHDIAISSFELEALKALISHPKVDVYMEDNYGDTALHIATFAGNIEAVKLLSNVININVKNSKKGSTPLHYALAMDRIDIVNELVKRGASVDVEDNCGDTALSYALARDLSSDIVRTIVVDGKANLNKLDKHTGLTPLLWAVKTGRIDLINLFLDNGADLEVKKYFVSSGEVTALSLAVATKRYDIADILLKHGAKTNIPIAGSPTLAHYAATYDYLELAKLLLKYSPASVNVEAPPSKFTPLHYAAIHGSVQVAKLLMDNKANINATDRHGDKPIDHAQMEGHYDIVQLLKTGEMPKLPKPVEKPKFKDRKEAMASFEKDSVIIKKDSAQIAQDLDFMLKKIQTSTRDANEKLLADSNILLKKHIEDLNNFLEEPTLSSEDKVMVQKALDEANKERGKLVIIGNLESFAAKESKYAQWIAEIVPMTTKDELVQECLGAASRNNLALFQYLFVCRGLSQYVNNNFSFAPELPERTFLYEAVEDKQGYDVVKYLLQNGADVNVKNANGKTPLDVARDLGDVLMIEILQKNYKK